MNAISQVIEVKCEPNQVEEAVLVLFHTILFHRSTGKFRYQKDDSYHIEELAFEDVTCTTFNLTYVRCASKKLDQDLRSQVARFVEKMRLAGVPTTGQVALEFYEKKKKNWVFSHDSAPWEVWNVHLTVNKPDTDDLFTSLDKVGTELAERIWYLMHCVQSQDCVPPPPTVTELDAKYETSYSDVQPYLFKVNFTVTPVNSSVTNHISKLLRDMASP